MSARRRSSLLVAALSTLAVARTATRAAADPMPPGAIGVVFGGASGTGADAKRLGAGYYLHGNVNFLLPLPCLQASWQPTTTERHVGWTIRGTLLFGHFYGSSARIHEILETVQMDLTIGLRIRPWHTPWRYLTARVGGELLRTNEPISAEQTRSFAGAIGSVGVDQYLGPVLISLDLRYGLVPSGPREIGLLVGVGLTGP